MTSTRKGWRPSRYNSSQSSFGMARRKKWGEKIMLSRWKAIFDEKGKTFWKLPNDFSGQLQDSGGEGDLRHLFNDAFAARYNLPRRTWRKGDVFLYLRITFHFLTDYFIFYILSSPNYMSYINGIFFAETKPSWSWGEIFAGRHFPVESVHFNHH